MTRDGPNKRDVVDVKDTPADGISSHAVSLDQSSGLTLEC